MRAQRIRHRREVPIAFDITQSAYRDFREVLKQHTNQVLIWSGAGVSASAELPTWPVLREILISDAKKKLQVCADDDRKRLQALVDVAETEPDAWQAFTAVKKALGETSYAAAIRYAFRNAEKADIPELYRRLWGLGITGFLNLNVDRLAGRAFSAERSGDPLREFEGIHISQHVDVLRSGTPFVANLHGILDNERSWIFTAEEFKELVRNPGYSALLQTCFTSRTVLFLGISADDPAASGHLQQLNALGLKLGGHYWLTDRADRETNEWAERTGIRQIVYRVRDGQHTEVSEFLGDLEAYVPAEIVSEPITPSVRRERNLITPSPEEIETMKANEIRMLLNKEAIRILGSSAPERFEEYKKLWNRYGEAIYRAWSVTTTPPNNKLFDYSLEKTIAKGAFGSVYEAKDKDGNDVAIKILHGNAKEEPDMMESFRRGVAAMRILSERDVTGMVPYIAAWEIPTCTVMDLVPGPNLEEAVDSGFMDSWEVIVRIAIDVAAIIRAAHQLPERVLHRDIRPPNVMLRDYYTDPTNFDVVMLDFDLSWHRDASGLSIDFRTTTNGYLAPEQLDPGRKNLTRNALVDSFGLGMTLYFLVCGKHPLVSQHRYHDWRSVLAKEIVGRKCDSWRSLPRRFARLIEWATKDVQSERWDMTRIYGELDSLRDCLRVPLKVRSLDLICEEIAARCDSMSRHYQWDSKRLAARIELKSGFTIAISADPGGLRVLSLIEWYHAGDRSYKDVRKYIAGAADRVCAELKRGGWGIVQKEASFDRCRIESEISAGALNAQPAIQRAADALSQGVAILRFD